MKFCKNDVLQNFPFVEDDLDALTDYQLFSKMYARVCQIYKLFKQGITEDVEKYIEEHFNDIMMQTSYDEDEEMLVLYLGDDNNG